MISRTIHRLTMIAAALALAGCASGPDYVRPATPLPANYAEATGSEQTTVNARWWTLFGDATLDQLVDKALQNNADLRLAIARVEQADAVAREAGASFFPEITGNAGGSNTQASTKTAIYNSAMPRIRNSRSASLSTSYELDLWGRVRRANEAAKASQLATAYARDSVRLSVAGLVTATYLGLRAADAVEPADTAVEGLVIVCQRDIRAEQDGLAHSAQPGEHDRPLRTSARDPFEHHVEGVEDVIATGELGWALAGATPG